MRQKEIPALSIDESVSHLYQEQIREAQTFVMTNGLGRNAVVDLGSRKNTSFEGPVLLVSNRYSEDFVSSNN